ncbi:CD209 antigen-like protein E [Stylophora pistillata]|uniref:CD209 antigen-like protein E n=1 Tax=Stylophora pistillata TaxID=50429 RepID=A0A2B4RB74_STYPI|nr:CD209 antigen-like protein E [Stylophora pistillata]
MKVFPGSPMLVVLLVVYEIASMVEGQTLVQNGKINFTASYPDLHYCTNVQFPRAFSSSRNVRVITSISYESNTRSVHNSAVVWTSDVTQSSFRVCVLESGPRTNGSAVVNWIAFRSAPSGMLDGTASLSAFTSGTKCERVTFAQDWLAFTRRGVQFKFQGKLFFENGGAPREKDNYAFCKIHNFTKEFYAPPVVIVSVNHLYDSKNVYSIKPENNVLNTWIEEITISSFRVCLKDLAGMESQHDPVTLDYAVIGDLDPCINVSCNYFAICKAFGPKDARCICVDDCPSYDEPVCSSNGTTYDNECIFQREMCDLQANFTLYHPGDCTGFPSQKGRHRLNHHPNWAEAVCEQVPLVPYVFYPDKPVHIQVSVNHVNFSDPSYVHEAVVAWVEDIRENNFTVCVTQAGRNEKKNGKTFASVDWLAYQGAPDGGVSGEMDMPTWWTGTSCRTVSLLPKKFESVPTVLVSAQHERRGVKHDASSVWVEDLTTTSFKICIRELQNFDGTHQSIHVDWMAFEELHRPLFREHGSLYFANGKKPSKEFNYAFCEDVVFKKPYNDSPAILVSANHSTNGGNLNPMYNSISVWAEYINKTGFRACVKEIFVNHHDPLSVSYAVMPDVCELGWNFYNGSCYYTSDTCKTWSDASTICRSMGANLPAIESQEENVYIQHRHNSEKAWIGLNDIATEGLFTWVDGCPDKFRYWAESQPNDFQGEDCVHSLGPRHGYMWNDIDCSACQQYTCKKDYDECSSSPCLNGGTCVNKKRNFTCICPQAYKGRTCDEFDECSSSPCLNSGTCTDGINNYTCSCPSPYFGRQCQAVAGTSCKTLLADGFTSTGSYTLRISGYSFQVYCDMTGSSGGWTLIARFSNSDAKNWMRDDAYWWYDIPSSQGSYTSTSPNSDMISEAFWKVKGTEIRITRSDDSSHSALLRTYNNCFGGKTFRGYMSSYGKFSYRNVWSNDRCLGSCPVYYGGWYRSTVGFSQAHCSSNIQGSHHIGFWCQWDRGDGSVLMIGGGGSGCSRADHGIGITENTYGTFDDWHDRGEFDFGDEAGNSPTTSYALNLWIR